MKFDDLKVEMPSLYSKINQAQRARLREQYIQKQNNLCWFCQRYIFGLSPEKVRLAKLNMNLFPTGFLRNPIHLHHDHKTDLTIGAVHAECNAYLWQYLNE